jgi:hypothetical protein
LKLIAIIFSLAFLDSTFSSFLIFCRITCFKVVYSYSQFYFPWSTVVQK